MITKEQTHYWSDMANLTHATQVSTFGWCSCEDNEGNPNPYDDCPNSWEHDECQCGNLGWVNGEGKCSQCENPCTHDWYFINGDNGEMKCAHCGECQN